MSTASPPEESIVAPAWHTALLVGLIVSVAIAGVAMTGHAGSAPVTGASARTTAVYLPGIVVAWALAGYVVRVGRARSALGGLVGRRWSSLSRGLGDLALAAAAFAIIEGGEIAATALAHHAVAGEAVRALLPATGFERGVWVLFALSVGVSEELVYRGYLRIQLGAFARRGALGVLFQGILFGVAHLDQGVASAARVACYGIALGALAAKRHSLLPGMIAHVAIDLASGLAPR